MRAIKYDTEQEAIDSWNELEELLKPLPYNFDDVIELDKNNYFSDDIF